MAYTLLLADDSVTIQRVIALTFADEDVQVVAVSDGDQAIAQLEASAPDIVLADIGMPGKNGYEVAQYIKRSPRHAHIPVVLLTGAFEPVDQARLDEAGCDGVLAKPFEPQLVIARVKDLLSKPKPPATAAAADLDRYFERLDAAFANLDAATDLPKPAPAPPAVSSEPAKLPSLADAFAAILAAEQSGPSPSAAPTWPTAGGWNTAADDELVEQVTRRVLDRLSNHRVLRETVADIVSSIAERLVREEIERIKASIK